MRFITTKIHAVLDYSMGLLLILSPWIFGFATGVAAQVIPMLVGVMIILMSMFTNYEGGAVRILSMPVHLGLDIFAGLFLAVSPWLFGFAEVVFWPHLILGLLEAGAGLFTKQTPFLTTAGSRPHEGQLP